MSVKEDILPSGDGYDTGDALGAMNEKQPSEPQFYGVKSHLHHFYEGPSKNEDSSAVGETDYLFQRKKERGTPCCRPLVWKIFVWIGINFMLFGLICAFVSYLIPKKEVFVSEGDGRYGMIDESAETFNNKMDNIRLVGLIGFFGGSISALFSLLIPTITLHFCNDIGTADANGVYYNSTWTGSGEEESGKSGSGKWQLSSSTKTRTSVVALAGSDAGVTGADGGVTGVTRPESQQPERRPSESRVTHAGLRELGETTTRK